MRAHAWFKTLNILCRHFLASGDKWLLLLYGSGPTTAPQQMLHSQSWRYSITAFWLLRQFNVSDQLLHQFSTILGTKHRSCDSSKYTHVSLKGCSVRKIFFYMIHIKRNSIVVNRVYSNLLLWKPLRL